MIAPPVVALRSDPAPTLETAKLVVVAAVPVAVLKTKLPVSVVEPKTATEPVRLPNVAPPTALS